jgi:hypothetical protein
MKLLTEEIKKRLPKLYATESIPLKDKVCVCKFFTPWTYWTWYVVEGSQQEDGDWLFWGLVHGDEKEWGYFLLNEMEAIRGPFGLKIERDLYWGNDGKRFKEFHLDYRDEDDEPSIQEPPKELPVESSKLSVKEMALKIQQDIEDLIDRGEG